MFHLHCWHLVEGSERKLRHPERCQSPAPEYIYWALITCRVTQRCCICNKTRYKKKDYDISEGSRFPDVKED